VYIVCFLSVSLPDLANKDVHKTNRSIDYVLTAVCNGTVSEDVNNAIPLQQQASADQLCLVSGLDSIKKECDSKMEKSSANEESQEDHMMRPDGQSSGTDTSELAIVDSDTSIAEGVVNEAVGRSSSLDATIEPVDPESGSVEKEFGDVTVSKNAGVRFHVAVGGSEEHCLHCSKPRPPQQCPVCCCMYASVPLHIGVHSIKKSHLPTPDRSRIGDGSSEMSEHSQMCTECGEILPTAKALRSHSRRCMKFVKCMVCGTNLTNERYLRLHMKQHMGTSDSDMNIATTQEKKNNDDLCCAVCEMDFDNSELLSQHMEEHMDTENRMCSVCRKTFLNVDGLKLHMRSHMGKMPYQCETCGKACRTQRYLKDHREIHSSERTHVCTTCGKQFRLRKTYMRHKILHTGERKYACEYCGMRFWFNYQRTRHMLVHTGDKPYLCNRCGERFAQWNGLKQHRLRSCQK